MAGIGLYGVYYSKCVMTDGVLTGYSGSSMMGKAISATFEPGEANSNPLYANNTIAEQDAASGAGGTLNVTLDRISAAAYADLFGVTSVTESSATGFNFTGNETPNPVGVAFIRWAQEDNDRDHYQAVIFSHVLFGTPSDNYQTMGESVEWQTPELEGTVASGAVTGEKPWRKVFNFTTQAAAQTFIQTYFAATT